MKTQIKIVLGLILAVFTACTDVVDVDVPTAAPRLVIEASIDWEKGTTGNDQVIKLSTSTPYFDTTTSSIVTGASVRVTNDTTGDEFIFTDQNDGTYTTNSFVPVLNQSYTLTVVHGTEVYTANETMMPVASINEVNQSTEDGFDTEMLEVNVLFDDPADEENYYLAKFQAVGDLLPNLEDVSDEFTNGNEMTVFFEKEDEEEGDEFQAGDVVDISLHGISSRYYEYIRLLIEQSDSGGGPFDATPAQLRGNCINAINPDNYAFGYFRVTEVDRTSYTFQ